MECVARSQFNGAHFVLFYSPIFRLTSSRVPHKTESHANSAHQEPKKISKVGRSITFSLFSQAVPVQHASFSLICAF